MDVSLGMAKGKLTTTDCLVVHIAPWRTIVKCRFNFTEIRNIKAIETISAEGR